ncbi:PAS domain S-box protein [Laspinema olomoucense]|uniref:PAS domain S-box protein n=1 Tax=Laspinema olomoucense TaxID=3231600 RepID=UPI0021BB32D5|nr:PAS domain S-box protein [Laspinema sp. D3c]MCT7995832.1 PAS domain S-box protein [Laspinema sp. D3c]
MSHFLKMSDRLNVRLNQSLDCHPVKVPANLPLKSAIALMNRARSSYVLVTDYFLPHQPKIGYGLFTEGDLVTLAAAGLGEESRPISEVLTQSIIPLKVTDSVDPFSLFCYMEAHQIRYLPIQDREGKLLGVVTHESLHQGLQRRELRKQRLAFEGMSPAIATASPRASILEVIEQMATHRSSCVVICHRGEEISGQELTRKNRLNPSFPIGIITRRDIVQYHALGLDLANTPASQVMSQPLLFGNLNDSLQQIHHQMQEGWVRHWVIVTARRELVGIVTPAEILQGWSGSRETDSNQGGQGKGIEDKQPTETRLPPGDSGFDIRQAGSFQEQQRQKAAFQEAIAFSTLALQQALEQQQAEIFHRQLAQKLLQFSEERFRQLAESIEQVFWLVSSDLKQLIYMSPAFETVWGISREQLERKKAGESGNYLTILQGSFYWEEGQPTWENWPQQVLAAGELENRIIHPDGTLRWVHSRGFPVYNDHAQVYRIAGITTDITSRKAAEAARQESEDRYRQLVETTTDWVWEIDEKGVYTYSSPRIRDMLGYEPREAIGKRLDAWILPEWAEEERRWVEQLATQPEPFSCKERVNLHKHGSVVVLESSGIPIFDEMGKLVGYRGIDRDITARKDAEAALQQINQELEQRVQVQTAELRELIGQLQGEIARRQEVESALRQSEERLESILGSLNDVVWSASAQSRELLYLNPAFEKIYGRSRQEFFENPELWRAVVHPDDSDRVRQFFEALLVQGSQDVEYRIIRPDGEVRWLEDRAHLLYDPTRQGFRMDGVARDITERKQAEEAIALSERRFHAIFNQTFQFMALLSPEGMILEMNQRALEVWGLAGTNPIGRAFWECPCWQPTDPEKLAESLEESEGEGQFCSIQGANRFRSAIAQAAAGELWRDEVEIFGPQNQRVTIDVSIKPVRDDGDRVIQLIAEGRDISDRKRLETEIFEREQLLNSFFKASSSVSLGLGIVNDQMQFIQVNEALAEVHGLSPQEHIGKTVNEIMPDVTHQVQCLVQELLQSGTPILNLELSSEKPCQPGVIHHWLTCYFPVPLKNGLARGVGFIVLDITQRKQAEQALRQIQERLEYLLCTNPTIIYSCKPTGDYALTFISQNILRQFGYEAQQLLENPNLWFECIHPDDAERLFAHIFRLQERTQEIYEYRVRHQNSTYRWVRDERRLVCDPEGNPLEIVGSMYDITEQKKALGQLKASLQEKEVLLKEIHHRVKNNLQVISSLLNLQSRSIQDSETRTLFQDSQNRIQSIAFIHEKLYQSRDLAQVDFSQYIQTLCLHLFRSYGASPHRISLNIKIDEIFLSVDTAIPCGLIVNELVCNALKHGFPPHGTGAIEITLYRTFQEPDDNSKREFMMRVQDNGVGFPSEVDFRKTRSLGMQLINTLVKQLKGTIELDRSSGTAFQIVFSAKHHPLGEERHE